MCILVWGYYYGNRLYFVTCLVTEHITWHMVPSFLYDHAQSALSGTPLPSNPSWSTDNDIYEYTHLLLQNCENSNKTTTKITPKNPPKHHNTSVLKQTHQISQYATKGT